MKHNYEIEIKAASGGRKSVVIKLDGKVIGKRTSARIYRFALVVTGNQAHALANALAGVEYQKKMVAKYQAIVDDAPSARNNFIMFDERGKVHRMDVQQWHRSWIDKGEVAKWLEHAKIEVKRLRERADLLGYGPHSDFQQPSVTSWHQQRKNVPTPREWHLFYDVIEIPVTEQIEAVDGQIDTSMSRADTIAMIREGHDS